MKISYGSVHDDLMIGAGIRVIFGKKAKLFESAHLVVSIHFLGFYASIAI